MIKIKCNNFFKKIVQICAGLYLFFSPSVFAEYIEYEGMIEPSEVIDVGSSEEGIVNTVEVERSDSVKINQVLVKLNSSVELAAFKKAKAVAGMNSEVNLQEIQLALAERAHERVKQLAGISSQDKDQAETEVLLSVERLERARENRILAEIELEKAGAVLKNRTVVSPITGIIVERYVSVGEYVNGQPLVKVAQINPLRIEVIVPAEMFGKIIPGMKATVIPELNRYGENSATVFIVDRVIDPASNTFGVRLEMTNPEDRIPCGLKCQVRFELNKNSD